jgi:hypothetical protein
MLLRNLRNVGSPTEILLLALVWTAAVSWTPRVVAGVGSEELVARGQEIENMTAIERDRLERNWALFQSLPDERKQHYRDLHQQVQQDRTTGGRLHDTLETYSAWLQTLSPGKRADLREATDPAKKLELVRKFKKEQDERQSHALEDPAWDVSQMRGRFRPFGGGKVLESSELKAALQALAKELPANKRPDVEFDSLRDKWGGYQKIVATTAEQAGGRSEWPSPAQQKVIESALKADEQIANYARMQNDDERRRMFGRMILNSLTAELHRDGEVFLPKESELPALFEHMSGEEREKIMQNRPREMNWQLMRKYFESKRNDPAFQEFQQIRREVAGFTFAFWRDADLGRPDRFGRPLPGPRPPGERGFGEEGGRRRLEGGRGRPERGNRPLDR